MVSLRALTKLITGLTPVIGYNRYLMFLENYFLFYFLFFILFIASLMISFLFFEILTFFFKLTVRLNSLMVPNPGGGSSSTGNGNNKPNNDWDWSWNRMFEGAASGALGGIAATAGAKALFSEPETTKQVINNINYKFFPKIPFSSACVLGLSFPIGCYFLTAHQKKPQVPKPDFIPSVAETSCFENCIYLIKHPWILVLSGLEGIAFALLFGLIVRKFIGNFTITNKWVDLALYLSLFIILNIFVGSYKPLTWLATAYDTELYQNFLEKVITDSPLIWENITWFWYIVVTVGYSLWIYIVVKFYRTSL